MTYCTFSRSLSKTFRLRKHTALSCFIETEFSLSTYLSLRGFECWSVIKSFRLARQIFLAQLYLDCILFPGLNGVTLVKSGYGVLSLGGQKSPMRDDVFELVVHSNKFKEYCNEMRSVSLFGINQLFDGVGFQFVLVFMGPFLMSQELPPRRSRLFLFDVCDRLYHLCIFGGFSFFGLLEADQLH